MSNSLYISYLRTFLSLVMIVTGVILPSQTVMASEAEPGEELVNTVTIAASEEDVNPENNTAAHLLTVAQSPSCNDLNEPNNAFEQATSISYGARVDADICPAGDEDYYVFNGAAGDRIVADIDADVNGSELDSYLYLYDSDRNQLAYNDDDYASFDSHIEYTLLADGMYYLKVREYSHPNDGGSDYYYTLSLNLTSPVVGPLTFQDYVVDDDTQGQSSGNANGVVNCGETIELYVHLYNQGDSTAQDVAAVLSTDDDYVTMISDRSDYPDIEPDTSVPNVIPFVLRVADETPGVHLIPFTLNISASNGGPWQDSFQVPISCRHQAQWTFMVYLDGDNNLEGAGIEDFLEMSSVGSNDDVNIVVQFDRVPEYDNRYGGWTDTRRFYVTYRMEPWPSNGTSIGEANMGDPQTLVNFVQWAMQNYPARHYALVLWDHGSGWRLRQLPEPLVKDVAFDETSDLDAIDMPELREALEAVSGGGTQPLDLVGFDACLMAMIEVDNQLIPYAQVRVGSEEVEPGDGWPYDAVLQALVSNPTMSAEALGEVIVDAYYASYGDNNDDVTQSAAALGSSEPYGVLNAAVDNFAAALITKMGTYGSQLREARLATQRFYVSSYIDLYDFAAQVMQRVDDTQLDAAAAAVMDAVGSAVIREQHGSNLPGAHGISIYFPTSSSNYDLLYDGDQNWLQFTTNTQWDEWLHAYYTGGGAACGDLNEPNNSFDQATSISYDASVNADICPAGDEDYYVFNGSAGDRIVADIDAEVNGSKLDSYLYLYDSNGTLLTSNNDDDDVLDSRIFFYRLPANGRYYLKVRDYAYDGDPEYFYTLSLDVVPPPPDVVSRWSTRTPTPDGHIQSSEWDDAAVYDITVVRAKGERPRRAPEKEEGGEIYAIGTRGGQARVSGPVRTQTVRLYVKNDATHLYLAIDNPNDTTADDWDQMGVYFDDNPLPSDGRWTNTTCDNPDGEGNFWVLSYGVEYREIVTGPWGTSYCDPVDPAPGTTGAVGHASGHAQAEVAIDLTASALRASPGDAIGMYLWILNDNTGMFDGQWPLVVQWDEPISYGQLRLARKQMLYLPVIIKR